MQSITYANNNKLGKFKNNGINYDNFISDNNKNSKFDKDLNNNKNERNYYIIDK